jgi:hypothetical protein
MWGIHVSLQRGLLLPSVTVAVLSGACALCCSVGCTYAVSLLLYVSGMTLAVEATCVCLWLCNMLQQHLQFPGTSVAALDLPELAIQQFVQGIPEVTYVATNGPPQTAYVNTQSIPRFDPDNRL